MSSFSIRSAGVTDVGLIRECNEDSILSWPERGLWVIADGMGGAASGEVASKIVLDVVQAAVEDGVSLPAAIVQAHHQILAAARSGIGGRGMGSTVVASQMEGARYQIAWVGDSRAYRWDGNELHQLTRDHSLLQNLIDNGTFRSDQAARFRELSVLQTALGHGHVGESDVGTVTGRLEPGEAILLCSDGLYGEVAEHEMASILLGAPDEQSAVTSLLDAALKAGGGDNVTIQLMRASVSDSGH